MKGESNDALQEQPPQSKEGEEQQTRPMEEELSQAETLGNPQPGDLVEYFLTACQHWAIYVGNEDVVHIVPERNIFGNDVCILGSSGTSGLGSSGTSGLGSSGISSFCSTNASSLACATFGYAMVKIEPIKEEGGYEYRINNKYDARYNPRPVDEIVSEAKAAVGTKVSYNLLNNNCEHFVTNLRYGVPVSDQVTFAGIADTACVACHLLSDAVCGCSVETICTAIICTVAFFISPICTVAVAGSALLLHQLWRRRQHEHA